MICKLQQSNEKGAARSGFKASTPYHSFRGIDSQQEVDVEKNLKEKHFHTRKDEQQPRVP